MWNTFKWLVYYIVVQFLMIFALAFIYVGQGNNPDLLGEYYKNNQIYMVIILAIIFIPLLYKEYKKINNIQNKLDKIHILILVGIFLSIFYNILAFYLNKYILNSNIYGECPNILLNIFITGLIGPIIEELMFRGVIYNKLKEKYDIKKAALITTIVFSLSHFNIIQIIYTFVFGLILIKVYEQTKNIKAPIILHMASNITTTLITCVVIKENILLNIILFITSATFLYLICKKYDKMK